jgi:hypothetical protein
VKRDSYVSSLYEKRKSTVHLWAMECQFNHESGFPSGFISVTPRVRPEAEIRGEMHLSPYYKIINNKSAFHSEHIKSHSG